MEAPAEASPGSYPGRPASRSTSRILTGALVVTAVAALGYYGYTRLHDFFAGMPEDIERAVRRSNVGGGGFLPPPDSAAGNAAPTRAIARKPPPEEIATPTPPAAAETPPAPPKPVAAPPPPVPAPPKVADRPAPPPKAEAGASEACTEAKAALGLCIAGPPKEAPDAEPARETAGGQRPAQQKRCTEAMAALGLCTL